MTVFDLSGLVMMCMLDGYGGVLLAISNQLTSTQITKAGTDLDLETNCENVWAKISYEGNKSLYTLFTNDGFVMHSRSSVVSFRVFLFMTCVRLLSCNLSRCCWCSEASGLLGMTAGVFQSNII
jgi:hypothetical protein